MKFPGHVWKVITADHHCVGMAEDSADLPPIPPGGCIMRQSTRFLRDMQWFADWRKANAQASNVSETNDPEEP